MAAKTVSTPVHHDWRAIYNKRFDLIECGLQGNQGILVAMLAQDRLSEVDQAASFRQMATNDDERIKKELEDRAIKGAGETESDCDQVKTHMDDLAKKGAKQEEWVTQFNLDMDDLEKKSIAQLQALRKWGLEKISQMSEGVRATMAKIFAGAVNAISLLFSEALKYIAQIIENIVAWLKKVWDNIKLWGSTILKWSGHALDTIKQLFGTASGSLDALASKLYDTGVHRFTLVCESGKWVLE
ncbi:hypothetical protein G3M48_006065 [Beauveria asiatica]|uniref:Uncharacterized protein n=1 Tax=Beauveria asiatica TaxID=1069075 RepID=A0AAW0RPU6_9HYPO